MVVAMALKSYGLPIALISSFKYLGRVLTVSDNYWTVVIANLRKTHHKWA